MDAQAKRRAGLSTFWVIAGVLHFLNPRFYEAIVPPPLRPLKRQVVSLSGVAEILGGVAVLPRRTRGFARAWLLATLVAVFPSNIYMAVASERFKRFPAWALWGRLPLQGLIAWFVVRGTD